MQDDYQAGLDGRTHYGGQHSADYQRGLAEREGRSGKYLNGAANAMGQFGGGYLIIFLLMLSTVLLVISLCLFPVAGGLTFLAYQALYGIFYDPMVSETVYLFVFMMPGFVLFIFFLQIEDRLAAVKLYRQFRYLWRMTAITFMGYSAAIMITEPDGPVLKGTLSEILPFSHILTILVCLLSTHFLSRWMDRNYAGMDVKISDLLIQNKPTFSFRRSAVPADYAEFERKYFPPKGKEAHFSQTPKE